MLVLTGFFDNDKFIPDNPVSIPQKKKVRITIDDTLDSESQDLLFASESSLAFWDNEDDKVWDNV